MNSTDSSPCWPQNVTSVRDAVNGLIKSDQFLRGFQDRGISVYQVSLESFDFLPAPVPQAVPPAPPPVLILATRKSSGEHCWHFSYRLRRRRDRMSTGKWRQHCRVTPRFLTRVFGGRKWGLLLERVC